MAKFKDEKRLLKAAREKQLVIYKETCIRLSADISAEILQVRMEWHNIVNGERENPITNTLLSKVITSI